MPKKKHNNRINYVVMVANEFDSKHATLRDARKYRRSLINLNEVKGIQIIVDIYKETVSLKKLSSERSDDTITGDAAKVFDF
jgi:hypothetical protein